MQFGFTLEQMWGIMEDALRHVCGMVVLPDQESVGDVYNIYNEKTPSQPECMRGLLAPVFLEAISSRNKETGEWKLDPIVGGKLFKGQIHKTKKKDGTVGKYRQLLEVIGQDKRGTYLEELVHLTQWIDDTIKISQYVQQHKSYGYQIKKRDLDAFNVDVTDFDIKRLQVRGALVKTLNQMGKQIDQRGMKPSTRQLPLAMIMANHDRVLHVVTSMVLVAICEIDGEELQERPEEEQTRLTKLKKEMFGRAIGYSTALPQPGSDLVREAYETGIQSERYQKQVEEDRRACQLAVNALIKQIKGPLLVKDLVNEVETILEISKMTWKQTWAEFGIDRKVKELVTQYVEGRELQEIQLIDPQDRVWNQKIDRLNHQLTAMEQKLRQEHPDVSELMDLINSTEAMRADAKGNVLYEVIEWEGTEYLNVMEFPGMGKTYLVCVNPDNAMDILWLESVIEEGEEYLMKLEEAWEIEEAQAYQSKELLRRISEAKSLVQNSNVNK